MTDEQYDEECRQLWASLNGAEKDTLIALCKHGPLWDGDVPSKSGRDGLLDKWLAAKVIVKHADGFQAATYKGWRVYKLGFVEPRKDVVRKLVGPEWVKP